MYIIFYGENFIINFVFPIQYLEIKSLSDCINFINFAINGCIIESLDFENIRNFLSEQEQSYFNRCNFGLSEVLKQLNSIIEFIINLLKRIKSRKCAVMKLILDWLIKRNTKPEDDDQQ